MKYKASIIREMHEALRIASELDAVGIRFVICDAPFSIFVDNRKCSQITFRNKKDYTKWSMYGRH